MIMADMEKIPDPRLDVVYNFEDPINRVEMAYQMLWRWADFHLYINAPTIPLINPPIIHEPELLPDGTKEFVYPIVDYGFQLSTSKGIEMNAAGLSMCKLYYTIEKMIALLIERLKSAGIDTETEVHVGFGGFEMAKRKAFEVVINLGYNVIADFDPGPWGEMYLERVKNLAEKYNFPFPPEA